MKVKKVYHCSFCHHDNYINNNVCYYCGLSLNNFYDSSIQYISDYFKTKKQKTESGLVESGFFPCKLCKVYHYKLALNKHNLCNNCQNDVDIYLR